MDSARPFRAFVSYCHKDAAFAAGLQRKLESYRLPKRLADKVTPLPGQAPGRIGPVFRDREDLSAATDLSAAVREAIAASSALVVVASPDAARSQWVAREITLFRVLHPEAPILVALARGEPHEALPEALRGDHAEPLCADFRKAGDGKRLAFLKIVAGLADLPLDTLVQRDAQRQMRRVMAVTLGAAVLVVIMALLLIMALRAREEAERRRAGAEGLVEYMLTDLRGRLKGVGRLEIMAAVNQRALAYYVAQGDLLSLPDDSLERRARLLHAMGEDDDELGQSEQALVQFTEANRTTSAILARKPKDPDTIFAHAQTEYWLGLIAWRHADRPTATQHWQSYARLARALAEAEPGSIRSLMELGYAAGGLCELAHSGAFDRMAALRHCGESIAFENEARVKQAARVGASTGESRSAEIQALRKVEEALANRYGWMARVQLAQQDVPGALRSRALEASLLDGLLAADPVNFEYSVRRSWSDIGTAASLIKSGAPERAVQILRRCLDRHRPVFAAEGAGTRVVETQFRLNLWLAKALRLSGSPYAAELAAADRYETQMAQFGSEHAAKVKAIRADIWPRAGDGK